MKETMTLPYSEQDGGKKEQVAKMFNSISGQYDFLNHFLSMGIDRRWRKKTINLIGQRKAENILDVATGTGDFAIESMRLKPGKIVGVDISDGMLEIGRKKIKNKGLQGTIELKNGDSEDLPFRDKSFDVVTVGFGVRNFENLQKGLTEMHRVLNDGGVAAILEFSNPTRFPVKQLYGFYFHRLLPLLGRWISKDRFAYRYLPESVKSFPDGERFTGILQSCGYTNVASHRLFFGVASIYIAEK